MKCNLKRLLALREMTQADLYRKSGIRKETINWYANNLVKRMNVEDLEIICNILECNLSDLIEYNTGDKFHAIPRKHNRKMQ